MTVVDELASCKDCGNELRPVDHGVEPALQEADQVCGRVALQANCFDIVLVELALGDVAVIALDLLLCLELSAKVGGLALAALAVLARTVFPLVERAPRTPPDVLAHAAVDLILRFSALRHRGSSFGKSGLTRN